MEDVKEKQKAKENEPTECVPMKRTDRKAPLAVVAILYFVTYSLALCFRGIAFFLGEISKD